jgi:hypothetical protein
MPASAPPAARWLAETATGGPAAAHTPSGVPLAPPALAAGPEDAVAADSAVATGVGAVDQDAPLPAGHAKLEVHRAYKAGKEAFRLRGLSAELPLESTVTSQQLRPPDIGLGNVTEEGEFPSEVLLAILEWSGNQQPLLAWIAELRALHPDLQLVIWDDTDYDIPWELLWLDPDQQRGLAGGCLGTLVDVSRWTTIRDAKLDRSPLNEPSDCSGGVVSYLAPDMVADAAAFNAFSHRPYHQIGLFLNDLDRENLNAGLLYIGCHAKYGSSLADLMLGTVTWRELNHLGMTALRGWQTLVFLNACHSGRLLQYRGQGEDANRGFAELFLRKGARACIASAGKVGDAEAHALLEALVEQFTVAPELPVSHILRRFRQAAVDALPWKPPNVPRTRNDDGSLNVEGQKQVRRLLYSFMFVYYGHPHTRLAISARAVNGP